MVHNINKPDLVFWPHHWRHHNLQSSMLSFHHPELRLLYDQIPKITSSILCDSTLPWETTCDWGMYVVGQSPRSSGICVAITQKLRSMLSSKSNFAGQNSSHLIKVPDNLSHFARHDLAYFEASLYIVSILGVIPQLGSRSKSRWAKFLSLTLTLK